MNQLLLTDSYKLTHWKQYPPKTQHVYSYFESRGGEWDSTVFFGLQYFLKKYLTGEVVTMEKITEAEETVQAHLGDKKLFNMSGWTRIFGKHKGKLPVSIKAVREGTRVGVGNVLMTIENTDPDCFWLTNYLETLLVQTWYPTTVATISNEIRKVILGFLEKTGDPDGVDFKLHDFGFRGVSSVESAGIGGAAHLVNFMGTDTVNALVVARDFYGEKMAGFSIPAAEHSTITSWGKEHEVDAMRNMLEQFPSGLVAVVSDSYDIYNACYNYWGDQLKDKVLGRDGLVVVRPDSGDPEEVVVRVLEILGEKLGYSTNEKGFKVLDPHVRVIQGDGVDYRSIIRILHTMQRTDWSADNIAFGMGGALLQKLHRDTQKFAFKCSNITVDGKDRDVFKTPVTDPGKDSKAGKLKLIHGKEGFETVRETWPHCEDQLVEVFRNGELLVDQPFAEIRKRATGKKEAANV